jgi:DNA replication protein DnaC
VSGKLREFFPGGNTSYGFYSFYDFIIDKDATRIFVIKGGPGVGKSTFMKVIGQSMLEKGFDVEFHNYFHSFRFAQGTKRNEMYWL